MSEVTPIATMHCGNHHWRTTHVESMTLYHAPVTLFTTKGFEFTPDYLHAVYEIRDRDKVGMESLAPFWTVSYIRLEGWMIKKDRTHSNKVRRELVIEPPTSWQPEHHTADEVTRQLPKLYRDLVMRALPTRSIR